MENITEIIKKLVKVKKDLTPIHHADIIREALADIDDALIMLDKHNIQPFDESPAGISKRLAQLELMIKNLAPHEQIGGPR
jgi:hypothetical protein